VSRAPDQTDRLLLDALQDSVPLVRRPYRQLAAALGASEAEVIARVAALSGEGGILREIAGIFDAAALGYASTLVAARCPPQRLERAGRLVAGHPGVSHCYGRAGAWNLWFTLTVPPDSRFGLEGTVEVLARLLGVREILSLPALRRYKLRVRFGAGGQVEGPSGDVPADCASGGEPVRLAPAEVSAVRALQRPLPAERDPFAPLAESEGLGADDLLVHAADLLAGGILRRYGAVLRHRSAGLRANTLVAWEVPPEQADAFGACAARFRAVSHCYLRRPAGDWPFTLYTMIHGHSPTEVAAVVAAIASAGGDYPRAELPTTREFKKQRVRLFSPEFARWERSVRC